ncbi:Wzz/FepE/Etk N-terminal domain-containing protein [Comamonas guangdongensis]|uniref:Wzz/FepE/Etk N-terminal domain-containing protein n=1 Tax=Comamonas guangdongensis TaxID=510515 RepID=A0ABV3ZX88_9BURK
MHNNHPASPDLSAPAADEEIDLLGLLVTLAEHWKLLILGPIVMGFAAFAISFALPKTYTSTSTLAVERPGSALSAPVAASMALSADVFHQIAPAAGLDSGLTAEEIRKKLSKRISVTVGKQDKLLTIETQARTPEAAQKLNTALLEALYPLTQPKGVEKKQLEMQLTGEKKRFVETSSLELQTAALLASGKVVSEATSRLYGELLVANSARQKTIADLEMRLEGLNQGDIVQQPTLPEEEIKPKKPMIAIGAAIFTGLALLIFVFARQALRSAQQSSPEQAEKIARIRRALPFCS